MSVCYSRHVQSSFPLRLALDALHFDRKIMEENQTNSEIEDQQLAQALQELELQDELVQLIDFLSLRNKQM